MPQTDRVERNFSRWFTAQFGKRPGGNVTTKVLCQTVEQVEGAYLRAKRIQDERVAWESTRDIALTVWLAKEKADAKD